MGITAKNVYQKPNPWLKTQLKENHRCFSDRKPPPPHLRQIDSSQLLKRHLCLKVLNQRPNLLIGISICLKTQPKSYLCKEIQCKKYLQNNLDITQSLKGQKELPSSLNLYVNHLIQEDTYVRIFIKPHKGQEAIKSVLIVIGDILSDLTSSFFYIYFCRRWVRGWLM